MLATRILVFGGLIGISTGTRPTRCSSSSRPRPGALLRGGLLVDPKPRAEPQAPAAGLRPQADPDRLGGDPGSARVRDHRVFAIVGVLYYYIRADYWYVEIGIHTLLVPAGLLLLLLFGLGIGLLTSAAGARARDVRFGIGYVLGFLYFLTPVIYPLSAVPEKWRPVAELNPLTGAIEMVKDGLFPSHELSSDAVLVTLFWVFVIWVPGLWLFDRREVDVLHGRDRRLSRRLRPRRGLRRRQSRLVHERLPAALARLPPVRAVATAATRPRRSRTRAGRRPRMDSSASLIIRDSTRPVYAPGGAEAGARTRTARSGGRRPLRAARTRASSRRALEPDPDLDRERPRELELHDDLDRPASPRRRRSRSPPSRRIPSLPLGAQARRRAPHASPRPSVAGSPRSGPARRACRPGATAPRAERAQAIPVARVEDDRRSLPGPPPDRLCTAFLEVPVLDGEGIVEEDDVGAEAEGGREGQLERPGCRVLPHRRPRDAEHLGHLIDPRQRLPLPSPAIAPARATFCLGENAGCRNWVETWISGGTTPGRTHGPLAGVAPVSRRSRVVFPDPGPPTRPTTSPRPSLNETSRSAQVSSAPPPQAPRTCPRPRPPRPRSPPRSPDRAGP